MRWGQSFEKGVRVAVRKILQVRKMVAIGHFALNILTDFFGNQQAGLNVGGLGQKSLAH